METMTFRWHSDPGHAWLEVPIGLIHQAHVTLTKYSYRRGRTAYLEEDVDAPRFLAKLEGLGISPVFVEVVYDEQAPIRGYGPL